MAVEQEQQFIEYVVKNLVDHPDDGVIERSTDDRGVLLKLTVHPDDMGKIIGKAGSTAKAIRTLLRVVGAKTDERLNLKIVDPEDEGGSEESTEDVQEAVNDSEPTEEAHPTEEEPASDELDADAIKAKAREGLEDLDMDI